VLHRVSHDMAFHRNLGSWLLSISKNDSLGSNRSWVVTTLPPWKKLILELFWGIIRHCTRERFGVPCMYCLMRITTGVPFCVTTSSILGTQKERGCSSRILGCDDFLFFGVSIFFLGTFPRLYFLSLSWISGNENFRRFLPSGGLSNLLGR